MASRKKRVGTFFQHFNKPRRSQHLVAVPDGCVYLVFSRLDETTLRKIFFNPSYFGIIRNKDGFDTCRQILLFTPRQIQKLNKERWPWISFRPYLVDIQRNLPDPRYQTDNLVVTVPNTYPPQEALGEIKRYMDLFTEYKMVRSDSWKCEGNVTITFNCNNIDTLYNIALIRILLINAQWARTGENITCEWQLKPLD